MADEESIVYEPRNVNDLTIFLQGNKHRYHEIWVVLVKKKHASPQPVSFNEAVSTAIAIGLVDSRTKTLDEKSYAVRFTKRRSKKA